MKKVKNTNNVIGFEVFRQRRAEVAEQEKDRVISELVQECLNQGFIPSIPMIMNRLRDTGVEKLLVEAGIWDEYMLQCDYDKSEHLIFNEPMKLTDNPSEIFKQS